MTGCRRCGSPSVRIEREGFTRRGLRRYATHWYRCDNCQEVFLSYRRIEVPDVATDLPDDVAPDVTPAQDGLMTVTPPLGPH